MSQHNVAFRYMYLKFKKVRFVQFVGFSLCFFLSACDSQQHTLEHSQDHQQQNTTAPQINEKKPIALENANVGRKLTEVAGQATLPITADADDDHSASQVATISAKAESLIGRYSVTINCKDRFALCDQGNAQFIINLLPDGTAHRTFVYPGKVTYDNNEIKSNRSYEKNTWVYDEENHEVIVNRIEGTQFFYKVDEHQNLVMDLEKILNSSENNRLYFRETEHPAPEKAYILKKVDN